MISDRYPIFVILTKDSMFVQWFWQDYFLWLQGARLGTRHTEVVWIFNVWKYWKYIQEIQQWILSKAEGKAQVFHHPGLQGYFWLRFIFQCNVGVQRGGTGLRCPPLSTLIETRRGRWSCKMIFPAFHVSARSRTTDARVITPRGQRPHSWAPHQPVI